MKMNSSGVHRQRPVVVCLLLVLLASGHADGVRGAEEHEHDEQHETRHSVQIDSAMAEAVGLGTAIAGPGQLQRQVLLYGTTAPDPQQVSHVKARYEGMIRSIGPALGDRVEAGEVIATIEANNSLQSYDIRAPIGGIVIEKHANPGEITGADSLLTIADYASLWVDFAVFPGDAREVRPGLAVQVSMGELSADSTIRYLNPGAGNSPTVTARARLANPELAWSPGLLVEGLVDVESIDVDLLVENRALQTVDGRLSVFVREGSDYVLHPLTPGRSDGSHTEVLEGLEPGSEYVVDNSYLLKADLEKSAASHDH